MVTIGDNVFLVLIVLNLYLYLQQIKSRFQLLCKWSVCTFSLIFLSCGSAGFITDYKQVPIIYDDLYNMKALLANYKPEEIDSAIIQREYFNKGTKGLQALIRKDNLNAEGFSGYVRENYNFLADVTSKTALIQGDSTRMRQLLLEFDTLIEKPRYMPTYFVIGQGKHGGTRTDDGFIIEVQMNVLGIDGIAFQGADTSWIQPYDNIDRLWVHEQVHVSRKEQYISGSLLRVSLDEGSCDFIAYLITGKKGTPATYSYGYENEKELYESWKQDLKKEVKEVRSKWVWNWGRTRDYPPDLGYFIGFRIAERYYNNQPDKKKAIQHIHDMKDYEAFYEKSGY